jgi:hypothetical protein
VSAPAFFSRPQSSRAAKLSNPKLSPGAEKPNGKAQCLPITSWRDWIFASALPLQGFMAIADLDLFRFGFGPLGNRDLQQALVVAGLHLLRVNRVGQTEGPRK